MFSMIELGAPDLFSLRLEGEGLTVFLEQCEYIFEAGGRLINDPYMRATAGRETFGRKAKLRGRFSFQRFDWSGKAGLYSV